jgi:hypothetical protein
MAIPQGQIISIGPDEFTIGSTLKLTVKWASEWDNALWVAYTYAACHVTITGGQEYVDSQRYNGGSRKEFTSVFNIGTMPSTPIYATIETYQKAGSYWQVITGQQWLSMFADDLLAAGPYTHIVDPIEGEVNPPPDFSGLKEWFDKYGLYAGAAALAGVGLVVALKPEKRK